MRPYFSSHSLYLLVKVLGAGQIYLNSKLTSLLDECDYFTTNTLKSQSGASLMHFNRVLGKHVDDSLAERRQIMLIAACNDVVIDDYFAVDPVSAGIADIILDRV